MSSGDVAVLGLQVDATQVRGATTALNQLAAAAAPAANAAHGLQTAHAAMSTQAMAAQHSVRSLVEAMASGMPISMALGQQLNHLSYAASGPGGITGAFGQAGRAILGLLSPTTLVLGGLAAVAAGSVLLYNSILRTEKAFDDTSHAAGVTISQLHDLAAAAAFKGIDSTEFLKGMDKFSADVYDAQHNMGQLGLFLRSNGQSATDFQGTLLKVADLIKTAGSDQARLQLLQQAGLPATMDWVRFLSQGSEGIKAAISEATKFGSTADEQMVAKARQFDEEWSKATTNLATGLKNAFLNAASAFSSFSGVVNAGLMKVGVNVGKNLLTDAMTGGSTAGSTLSQSTGNEFYNAVGTAAPFNAKNPGKTTVDPAVLQHQIQLQQQYLAMLGQTATASDAVRQVELSVQAARLSGVTVTQKTVDSLKALAVEQSLGITAMKQQTDSLHVETATLGMSAGEAARYTAVQTQLNDAVRAHRDLSDADVVKINAQATALGNAAQNADLMKFAFNDLTQGPLETFTAQIAQGATAMDALKAAGQSALNAIAKKLADMAAQNLWSAAFPGGGGGLFSLLGLGGSSITSGGAISGAVGGTSIGGAPLVAAGLHGGGGPGDAPTFMRSLPASLFNHAPRFHSGIGPGEQAAVIRTDESVLTPGQMKQLSPASQPVVINNYNTFTGNDPGTEARIKQQIVSMGKQAVSQAVQAVAQIKATTPSYLKAAR